MKKTAKSILLVMLMAVLVFALTGCGNSKKDNKEEEKSDKLVATRTQSDDTSIGNYTEIIEVSFKDEKPETVTMIMEFESEETAKGVAAIFGLASSEELKGIETKQEGNRFMMIMDAKEYASQEGMEEEKLTKEELKKALEEEGYEVK